MKPSTAKVYLSGIGIVSLSFFFWLFMYQMFVNVSADNFKVRILFDNTRMTVKQDEVVQINPYFFVSENDKISAATYSIKYPPNLLTYDSTMEQNSAGTPTEKRCFTENYRLNQVIKVDNDAQNGLLTITRVALEPAAKLPAGLFCLGTLSFKVSGKPGETYMNKIEFANLNRWQIVGPAGSYKPNSQANNEVLLIYRSN